MGWYIIRHLYCWWGGEGMDGVVYNQALVLCCMLSLSDILSALRANCQVLRDLGRSLY